MRITPATPMAELVSMFGSYPEHMAVVNDDIAALNAALVDVDVEHHEHTPLTLAICLHRDDIVEYLIEWGADVCRRTLDYNRWPAAVAAQCGNGAIMTMLVEAGANLNDQFCDDSNLCHLAAQNDDATVLRLLLDADVPCDVCNDRGERPIHFAAKNKNEQVIAMLLATSVVQLDERVCRGSINQGDRAIYSPIHIAAQNPNVAVVRLLIGAGVDVNVVSYIGTTPFYHACSNPNEQVLDALLAADGFDVNARDSFGSTPLLIAARFGTANLVSRLLNAGTDVAAVDERKQTACLRACKNASVGVMRTLIAAGAPFDADVLREAIRRSNLDAVRALINAGMDVARQFNTNSWLIDRDRMTGEMLVFLIRQGVDFRARDDRGRTLCHFASSECLALLFARGADLNVADKRGETPLAKADGDQVVTLIAAGVSRYGDVSEARQFELLRLRAFQVCVGLQDRQLPALVSCEILAHVFAPLVSLVAFHRVWAIVTTIKHFRH